MIPCLNFGQPALTAFSKGASRAHNNNPIEVSASRICSVLIFGAYSAIAQEVARLLAPCGTTFYLVGRDATKLDILKRDLQVRGAGSIFTCATDLSDLSRHSELVADARLRLHHFDLALIAHGSLPDQAACEKDVELAVRQFSLNGLSAISLMVVLGREFESQKTGCLAVISSVAGDRGRQSNYLYGSAKGAISLFAQGLRNRLHASGVSVLTVKPGFIDTPMTAGLKKNFLFANPKTVARSIVRAVERRADEVYTPCFWYPVMLLIKSVPEVLFKRLKL